MTWKLTKPLEDKILSDLEDGISLVKICQKKNMPSRRTVLRWQRENEDFGTKCARAREAAGDVAADMLDDINESLANGKLEASAASVISSNLKWKASKLKPRSYGDVTTLRGDKDNPIAPAIFTLNLGKPNGEADDSAS